jgi:thioredoxin-like negative regulator of GroEL
VWSAARAWFMKANRIDPNEVMPLYLYYTSFVAAKEKPTPGAVKALERAVMLAPESSRIALALARQMLNDGEAAYARKLLEPVAFAPHAPRDKNVPLAVIKLIDAGKIDEAKTTLSADKKDDNNS